jgi:hypothetical protein
MAQENIKQKPVQQDHSTDEATSEAAHETTLEGKIQDSPKIPDNTLINKDNRQDSHDANLGARMQHGGSGTYDDTGRESNHQHQNALSEKRVRELAAKDNKDK